MPDQPPDPAKFFRAEALKHLSSAEPLDDLVSLPRASNGAALLLAGLLLLVAALLTWISV